MLAYQSVIVYGAALREYQELEEVLLIVLSAALFNGAALREYQELEEKIKNQYFGGRIIFPDQLYRDSIISALFGTALGITGFSIVMFERRRPYQKVKKPLIIASFFLVSMTVLYFRSPYSILEIYMPGGYHIGIPFFQY